MRLISSTLLTVAFFVLFVVAQIPSKPVRVVGTLKEGSACVTRSTPEKTCVDGLQCNIGQRDNGGQNAGYCTKGSGYLSVGDVCVGRKGCRSGLVCNSYSAGSQGTPVLGPQKGKCVEKFKLGEECVDYDDCVTGIFCINDKCSLKKKQDEACRLASDCDIAFYCSKALKDKVGKCAKRKAANEVCDSSIECPPRFFCKTAGGAGICISETERYKLQNVGGVCGFNGDCQSKLRCLQLKPKELGKCVARTASDPPEASRD
jgi:hypothetical protein